MKRSVVLLSVIFVSLMLAMSCRHKTTSNTPGEPLQNDTIDTTLENLNDRIGKDSLNADNFYERSLYYIDNKDINSALSDIGKAIQLNDKNADYFVALSDIYLAMNRIPNCMEALKKAEEIDPKNNTALLKLAEVYFILQDYKSVHLYTKKALENNINDPLAYFIRGYAALEQGDTVMAIKNFEKTADLDQDNYGAYIELGTIYSAKHNPLAEGYFQAAVRINPNRPEGYYMLGMFYQGQAYFEKAVEIYNKLIVVSPGYKEAYYNLGYINLVHFFDFDASVDYFTKAINIDPKYTDAYFNRGYSYELMEDFPNARKDYQKALEITPNDENSINGLNRLDNSH